MEKKHEIESMKFGICEIISTHKCCVIVTLSCRKTNKLFAHD